MTKMRKTPGEGPSAWRGEDLQDSDEWIYRFTEGDLQEFEAALAGVRGEVDALRAAVAAGGAAAAESQAAVDARRGGPRGPGPPPHKIKIP